MSAPSDAERVQHQLRRLAAIERRYREMLLGNPTHPQGDALRALVKDGDFGVAWIAETGHDDVLQIRSNAGARTDALDQLAIRPGEGLTGKVFRSGEIDWVDAYFESSSITHDFDSQIRQERVERLIAVPLIDGETVVGVLAAGSRNPGLFGGIAVDHIVSAAGSVALRAIIDRRERRMAERVAAEERRRIAMDLHDSVGAMLFSIGADATGLRAALDPSTSADPSAAERLDRITAHTAQASVLLRRALRALHSTPGELALAAALETDCRAFEERSGVPTHVVVMHEPPELSDAGRAFVLRSLREALLNVEKHARAEAVAVTVSMAEHWLTLSVADDGVGLPAGSVGHVDDAPPGLGLAGLSDSASRLGGRLEVRTGDEGGTVWRLRLPV